MEHSLELLGQQGESITTAKKLYDVWVSACEKCYGERVRTTEYAALQGRLMNCTLAVKQAMSKLVNAHLSKAQMPTSTDVSALQRYVHENRQELKVLKAEIASLKDKGADEDTSSSVKTERSSKPKKRSRVVKRSAKKE